jgi:hypothetical protein
MAWLSTPTMNDPIEGLLRGGRPETEKTQLGYELPTNPSWKEKVYQILKDVATDPNNFGAVGSIKLPQSRSIIEEILQKIRGGKSSWAEHQMSRYPPGMEHVDRTGIQSELYRSPEINNIPYKGRFTEEEIKRVLGPPGTEVRDTHHGFYSPKGAPVGLGNNAIHRYALDDLLGYRSPEPFDRRLQKYVNDIYYENPINKRHTYDIPEMLDDTNLTRVYRANPRTGEPSYMEIPANITDEQLATTVSKFGKPPNTHISLAVPEEVKGGFVERGPDDIYKRYSIDDIRSDRKPTDQLIKDMIGRYAEDLGRYFR